MFMPSLERRKERIGAIATKVFIAKGYKTSSLQDIASKTGISKAGLYHYFKTKEEILWYIIKGMTERFINELKNTAKRCEAENLEPEEALKKYITTYAYQLNRSRDIPLLILKERHQLTGKYRKELHKSEQEIFHGIREQLSKVPRIREKHDLNVAAFLIISMSHWIGYWLNRQGYLSLESVVEQSIDIICHGILE